MIYEDIPLKFYNDLIGFIYKKVISFQPTFDI